MVTAPSKTAALLAFYQNLDYVADIVKSVKRDGLRLHVEFNRLTAETEKASKAKDLEALKAVSVALDRQREDVKEFESHRATVSLWGTVILVTCVEAYLQDILSAAAKLDSKVMGEPSRTSATYAEINAAGSLEELAAELRSRWARAWLRSWLYNSGPTDWITNLQKMGAKDYPDDLALRMERMWGIRHVVVHSAGVATPEFAARHPGVAAEGERIRLDENTFKAFLLTATDFLEPTEKYFIARVPALLVA